MRDLRSIVLGTVFAVLLCIANVYLAVQTGITAAATVPAALGILWAARIKRLGLGCQEQNVARTLATAGEILAAGVLFACPAFFYVLGEGRDHGELFFVRLLLMVLLGGSVGLATSLVLRRYIIRRRILDFPEAHAAERVVASGNTVHPWHAVAAIVGAAAAVVPVRLLQFSGPGTDKIATGLPASAVSPAILGLGYFIGDGIALQILFGNVLLNLGLSVAGMEGHRDEARFIAVGCLVGGSLLLVLEIVVGGLARLGDQVPASKQDVDSGVRGVEPSNRAIVSVCVVLLLVGFIISVFFPLGAQSTASWLGFCTVLVLVAFVASAASCVVVGLVGSSLNPISTFSFLVVLVGGFLFGLSPVRAVFVASVACIAAGVAGNLMQDFRVGQAVDVAPFRLVWAQALGVLVIACLMPLFYTWFVPVNWNPTTDAILPQASAIVKLIEPNMEYVLIGLCMSLVVWLVRPLRPAVVGIGMLLPFGTAVALALGGIVRRGQEKWLSYQARPADEIRWRMTFGTIVVCGFIVGEPLAIGVLSLANGSEHGTISDPFIHWWAAIPILGLLLVWLFWLPLRGVFDPEPQVAASTALFIIEPTFHGTRYPATAATIADRVVVVRRYNGPGSPGQVADELIVRRDSCDVVVAAISDHLRRWHIKTAGVVPGNDYHVPLAAEVADYFEWVGNPVSAAQAVRSKSHTRTVLEAHSVRCPRSFRCTTQSEAENAFEQLENRAVVKPPDMTGSLFVRKVETRRDMVAHTRRILERNRNLGGATIIREVIVEEFIDGEEFSVEMFVHRGDVVFASVTEKLKWDNSSFFVERQHVVPASCTCSEQDEALINAAGSAIRALGIMNGPVHAEIMLPSGGEPFIMEVAARVAGDEITKLLRLAACVDLHAASVRQALGMDPFNTGDPVFTRGSSISFLAAAPGIVRSVSGLSEAQAVEGVKYCVVDVSRGDVVHPLTSSMHRVGYVVAVGDEREDIKESAAVARDRACSASNKIRIDTT